MTVSVFLAKNLLLFLQFTLFVCSSYAQTNKLFQWQFANNDISTSLPTCQNFPIIVKSFNTNNSTHGKPPYFMMALAVSGIPILSSIGSDESNLKWQVTHPAGTQLMLSVVDSNGSAGGVPPRLYTVVTGQSTTCISSPPASASTFTVKTNVTKELTTCQPWGLTIKGGVAPYTVTLAALNSPVVTNVTLGPQDDAFTFIDRADPNTQLLAAVSDFTGAYANGTPIVSTIGSADVSCTGLVSSSGNATVIQEQAASISIANKRRINTIIAISVTLGSLILLAVGIFFVVFQRKKQRSRIDPLPVMYSEDPRTTTSRTSLPSIYNPPVSELTSSTSTLVPSRFAQTGEYHPRQYSSDGQMGANPPAQLSMRPSFTTFPPNVAAHRYNKAAEATMNSNGLQYNDLFPRSTPSRSQSAGVPRNHIPSPPIRSTSLQGTRDQGEIVIQHRDGGIVRELPPPYGDRAQSPS